VDRVAVNTSAFGHELLNLWSDAAQKTDRGFMCTILRLAGKDPAQIIVEISRPLECVLLALPVVMLAQRDPNLGKRFYFFADAVFWPCARNFCQQLINVLKLA